MFAILETGGKQYKVEEGDILEVELLETENEKKKESYVFENILLLQDKTTLIGSPYVKNAMVRAKILEEIKAPKILVFKKKSKKQYRRTQGHRQKLHKVLIEKIEIGLEEKPKTEPKIKTEEKPKAEPKAKTARSAAKPKATGTKTQKKEN